MKKPFCESRRALFFAVTEIPFQLRKKVKTEMSAANKGFFI
jgi:hypothetical protein